MVRKKSRSKAAAKKIKTTVRGQAAMEYLMTYGWAILVILIVLAVLAFYLPQFLRAQDQCAFAQPGFTCGDVRPFIQNTGNTVNLRASIFNQNGQAIHIQRVLCTADAPGNVNSVWGEVPAEGTITSAPSVTTLDPASGARMEVNVNCYRGGSGTNRGSALNLAKNNEFRGYLFIWYNFGNENPALVTRQVQATITGTVN